MNRPSLPSRKRVGQWWRRAADYIAAIGITLGLIGLLGGGVLAYEVHSQNGTIEHLSRQALASSENNHQLLRELQAALAEVKKAQTDHDQTLTDIANLQQQVASVIEALPAADAYLGQIANEILDDLNALCSSSHACTPISLPMASTSSTHSTTTPASSAVTVVTTTTVPKKQHGKRLRG